ncbi:hypothetical protein QN372_18175 [Undibacterium sp. RTI2.1]|uniref:hypothetical protein n=1 Tax=unclassified Undibacterium TaxID=2630295 RepID=UPI002AB5CD32|nr:MULTISPECIES: hypothetical protein [unclassified Undibacterium]MDY7540727.1 hypothetical protein [Undibacterium sp. 5I1]MEB0032679.1 hypothetical protein [Undibacterium sp. RTI2.1]MEB0118681.1 hypothetical protein [Undibacterium sp. RTI2.2]MEB0232651.1 hypothetical protein [Undibacterium sp. 10I3]MEB0259636.1 hypothetical protein [Undibacterium sp. 5I1]
MEKLKCLLVISMLAVTISSFGKSSSSHSMSGGFSGSTKSTPAKSAPSNPSSSSATSTKPTGFGSFGNATKSENASTQSTSGTTPSSQPKTNQSALSIGLDKNASQANALKTLDARNAAKTAAPLSSNASAQPTGFGRSSQDNSFTPSAALPSTPTASYQAPVIVQVPSSNYGNNGGFSWSSGLMGFMLGRSMNHDSGYSRQRDNDVSFEKSSGGNISAKGLSPDNVSQSSIGTEQPSFLMKLFRFLFWLSMILLLVWITWKLFFKKKLSAEKTNHYSLN